MTKEKRVIRMTRENIENIIAHMDEYASEINNMSELLTGLFIWWRLGSLDGINDVQLGKIMAILNYQDSVFSEELRNEIDEVIY